MEQQQIKNKIITIIGKEDVATANKKNTTVKITDQDGIKFVFWKKKSDGSFSAVQEQFKNMALDEGSTVRIGYVVDEYTDQKGVQRTSNKIINLQETNEQPVKLSQTQESAPRQEITYEADKDAFWEKKALKQCIWGYWLERKSNIVPTQEEMVLVANTFDVINKFVEGREAKGWDRAVTIYGGDEAPLPNEIPSVEDIPF